MYLEFVRPRDEDELLPILVDAVERCGPGAGEYYAMDYVWHLERYYLERQYVPLVEASFRRRPSFMTVRFVDRFADPAGALTEALYRGLPDELEKKLQKKLLAWSQPQHDEPEDSIAATASDRAQWRVEDGVLAVNFLLEKEDLESIAQRFADVTVLRARALTDDALDELSRLARLESLELLGQIYSDEQRSRAGLYALDRDPIAELVTRLHLSHITTKDLKVVGRLKHLRRLQVHVAAIRDHGFEPLAQLSHLEALELSSIYEEEFLGLGLVHVPCERLETLVLETIGCTRSNKGKGGPVIPGRTSEGVARFGKLRRLDLSDNRFAPDAFAPLVALTRLEELTCNDVGLKNRDLGFLSGMPALVKLTLWDNPGLSDAGMEQIATRAGLRSLRLPRTRVTNDGLQPLAVLDQLEELDIRQTRVTAEGLDALTGLPLKDLELGSKRLTDDAIEPLSEIHTLRRLVFTKHAAVSPEGLERLRAALPQCEVTKQSW